MRGAVHHIDLTIADLATSAAFYDTRLAFLGYRRMLGDASGIDWDLHVSGKHLCSIGLKPARSDRAHDRYSAGLHHLAWHAASRDDVDRLRELLLRMGAGILDAPAEYVLRRPRRVEAGVRALAGERLTWRNAEALRPRHGSRD
jgi:catechol 2,3-dioxygenase-like lactoylglutathione lyase family enzyme